LRISKQQPLTLFSKLCLSKSLPRKGEGNKDKKKEWLILPNHAHVVEVFNFSKYPSPLASQVLSRKGRGNKKREGTLTSRVRRRLVLLIHRSETPQEGKEQKKDIEKGNI
jgi:hypothetical protein